MVGYYRTRNVIVDTCPQLCKIATSLVNSALDGRVASSLVEPYVLQSLKAVCEENNLRVEIPPARHWFDIRIENIPINLKVTTGGVDNAFNKTAIYYSLVGREPSGTVNTFDQFYREIVAGEWKALRDPKSEYHYLVIDKTTGGFLFRSLLDIEGLHPNPHNTLQIHWKHEFGRQNIPPTPTRDAGMRILLTCQESIQRYTNSYKLFLDANIPQDVRFPSFKRDNRNGLK
jgi:hypothetical protein